MAETSGDPRWYALSAEETAAQLQVDPSKGLSSAEVKQRLEKYGPNRLVAKKKESRLRRLPADSTRTSCRSSWWPRRSSASW